MRGLDASSRRAHGRPAARERDLEQLFAATLHSLRQETGASRTTVWLSPSGGAALGALDEDGPVAEPSPEDFALLAGLDRACDLGDSELGAAVCAVARRAGFSACAPVGGPAAAAVLLLAGPADPPGSVRARTLARLGAAAERLEGPLAAGLAVRRLALLDANVRRLDRLAGIGALAAEIVHEVRNPLVSVKTFVQLLPDHLDDPEFLDGFLALASEELSRIERLLDAVMEQARPVADAAASQRGAPAGALAAVARLLTHRAAAAGVRLTTEVPPDLPAVAIGADGLRQVVLNLATNAVEATPAGGEVLLTARSLGHGVEIGVADRGPGVPPTLRSRIFEPFFSTKPDRPGGLGLAISRRIVEEAGGTLAVVDRPGGGAVFRLRLPAA